MKTNSARKTSPATPETKLRRVIKLDASQFAIYTTGTIDILNPDGEPIDCIGNTVTLLNSNEAREKLANNLRLIEELLLNSHDGIQLSEHAVAGLAETLSRAERMIGN
ncbi:hypothetical protein [Cellvibrio sp. UBA7671]|uniref:hypothetical protein n=1 Tax=Cellvibrio sp. UBA7671 TaxID=1946312 RepID=UPI002F35BA70